MSRSGSSRSGSLDEQRISLRLDDAEARDVEGIPYEQLAGQPQALITATTNTSLWSWSGTWKTVVNYSSGIDAFFRMTFPRFQSFVQANLNLAFTLGTLFLFKFMFSYDAHYHEDESIINLDARQTLARNNARLIASATILTSFLAYRWFVWLFAAPALTYGIFVTSRLFNVIYENVRGITPFYYTAESISLRPREMTSESNSSASALFTYVMLLIGIAALHSYAVVYKNNYDENMYDYDHSEDDYVDMTGDEKRAASAADAEGFASKEASKLLVPRMPGIAAAAGIFALMYIIYQVARGYTGKEGSTNSWQKAKKLAEKVFNSLFGTLATYQSVSQQQADVDHQPQLASPERNAALINQDVTELRINHGATSAKLNDSDEQFFFAQHTNPNDFMDWLAAGIQRGAQEVTLYRVATALATIQLTDRAYNYLRNEIPLTQLLSMLIVAINRDATIQSVSFPSTQITVPTSTENFGDALHQAVNPDIENQIAILNHPILNMHAVAAEEKVEVELVNNPATRHHRQVMMPLSKIALELTDERLREIYNKVRLNYVRCHHVQLSQLSTGAQNVWRGSEDNYIPIRNQNGEMLSFAEFAQNARNEAARRANASEGAYSGGVKFHNDQRHNMATESFYKESTNAPAPGYIG